MTQGQPAPSEPDAIELLGLRVAGFCGVLPEEQARRQPLELDVVVRADLRAAGRTDDLADTLDYASVAADVERVVVDERFALLERLAERVAEVVLENERAMQVTVAVRKLRPPVQQMLSTSGVRVTRCRV